MRLLTSVLLTVLASLGIVVTAGSGPALACSCAFGRMPEYVGYADEVFAGTLVDVERPSTKGIWSSNDPVTYTVEVDAVYQGDVGPTADVESAVSGASCGLDGMVVDRRYLVFTTIDGTVPTASLCGGTAPATPERLAAVERLLGAPTPPVAAAQDVDLQPEVRPATGTDDAGSGMSVWIVGGVLVGVAALVAAAVRLRRSA